MYTVDVVCGNVIEVRYVLSPKIGEAYLRSKFGEPSYKGDGFIGDTKGKLYTFENSVVARIYRPRLIDSKGRPIRTSGKHKKTPWKIHAENASVPIGEPEIN